MFTHPEVAGYNGSGYGLFGVLMGFFLVDFKDASSKMKPTAQALEFACAERTLLREGEKCSDT